MSAQNRLRAASLSFPSDLVRGVHTRASVERRSRETRERRAEAREEKRETSLLSRLSRLAPSVTPGHARDHLRVSGVLLDGLRKKRDCYSVNIA